MNTIKETISRIFTKTIILLGILLILYSCIYFLWDRRINYLLNTKGYQTVATIIRKEGCHFQYDIEYKGEYYRRWIDLTKKAAKATIIGERFHALILPDMLEHDHENGITPRYIKIILIPLPDDQQNINEEQKRIKSMYGYRFKTME